MDAHSLQVLEFDKICRFLAGFAGSDGGRRLCVSLSPAADPGTVHELLSETTEMRCEIEEHGPLPLSGIHDIRPEIKRARVRNAYLEQERFNKIRETLETAEMLYKYLQGREESCPRLHNLTAGIIHLPQVTEEIRRSISSQGEILDSASPELSDIRSRLKKIRRSILASLEQHLQNTDIDYAIQDDFITLRNNRFVIPVRSDSKSAVPGVVHDQSQSKATFFVEPMEVVTLNNELQILQKEEYYEEIRILTKLTQLVDAHGETITANLSVMERLDCIHARALFSRALSAAPPVVSEDGVVSLTACRHPILLAEYVADPEAAPQPEPETPQEPPGHWEFKRAGVVPIDLHIDPETAGLVITGANAGGKTVAMKTLGLFVLMAQAGLHLPAQEGSRVSLFTAVFADIGDEQSIETSLSTFSAHMSRINTIVRSAAPGSLVLLDELGSGTDPSEGGALAVAVLDHLRSIKCRMVITTHLNILKTYAYAHAEISNVSVAFDPVTHRPTYRLSYGVPGISNALAIAGSIGIPDSILENASRQIDGSERQVGELIRELEKTNQKLRDRKKTFDRLLDSARRHEETAARMLEKIKARKESFLKKFETDARRLLQESESQLKKLIKEQKRRHLVRPADLPEDDTARESFEQIKTRLGERFAPPARNPRPVKDLKAGQTVTVFNLQKSGTVVSADNRSRRAEIEVGSMRVKAGFDELEASAPPAQKGETPASLTLDNDRKTVTLREKQLTVIGMRVDEALRTVDKEIDTALLQGTETLEIIHGRGTGRLKLAIRDHLQDNRYVKRVAAGDPEKGGDGVTVVTFT